MDDADEKALDALLDGLKRGLQQAAKAIEEYQKEKRKRGLRVTTSADNTA
jgi:hypothetical protein